VGDDRGRRAHCTVFWPNRLLGQLYTYLYLSSEPQSLDELADGVGMSKASVSIACRQMEAWGALRKVWKKGDRKDYYAAETDFGAVLNNGLLASLQKKLGSAQVQIERSLALLDGEGSAGGEQAEFLRKRLAEAERYRARLAELMDKSLIRELF